MDLVGDAVGTGTGQDPRAAFVIGIEQECLTVAGSGTGRAPTQSAVLRFFEAMQELAPSLRAASGFFNPYGRIYIDSGDHIELALCECDSPYLVPLILERQQELATQAVEALEREGLQLLLTNNTHSALLEQGTATWGAHENYLVERSPGSFGRLVLPFLVTRLYAGAGGVVHPSGDYLAGVRHEFMTQATGGGTTECRAIHSTCRDEPLMGEGTGLKRYHLILGDGHRSQFNLALQLGATALALKAIFYDEQLPRDLERFSLPCAGSWVLTLSRFNRLARRGEPLRVDPLVIDVQRVYLDAARRYAATLDTPPPWIERTLEDWENTLDAMARGDEAWLAGRLDAFIKHEIFNGYLDGRWEQLATTSSRFHELALLDQEYHWFTRRDSIFEDLARSGALPQHRVGPKILPGEETRPFIPETATRARARANFIVRHAGDEGFAISRSAAQDLKERRRRTLFDPFARRYGPWSRGRKPRTQQPAAPDQPDLPLGRLHQLAARWLEGQPESTPAETTRAAERDRPRNPDPEGRGER